MRGKSDVSRLSGGTSSDHEFGEYLRSLLLAAVEPIEPADGGLKRIRARLGQRARRAASGLACRQPLGMPARWHLRCQGAWPRGRYP
jgi:hypothetical protein